MRLASIQERLGKVDDAAQSYERVLELDPADAEALAAMDALYRRTERWEDLIGVYPASHRARRTTAPSASRSTGRWPRSTRRSSGKPGRRDRGLPRGARRSIRTSQVALAALDGSFTRQGMWNELAENLETQLGLAETTRRAARADAAPRVPARDAR